MCLRAVEQINKPLLWKEEFLSLRINLAGIVIPTWAFILLIPRNVILQVHQEKKDS